MNFRVYVTNADINSHKRETRPMSLNSHWSVNATRPFATTLETKLMSALAQNTAAKVLSNQTA